jgi:hypothetical protein
MENNIITLSKDQRDHLEKFSKNGVHNAHLITRARVILALDRSNKTRHLRIKEICEQEQVSRQALCDIRKAFLEAPDVEAFLTRKKRETPPVPAKITGDVEAKIIATACSKAPEGYARWTVRLLAEKVVEFGFIDSISFKSVQTVLKKRNISLT